MEVDDVARNKASLTNSAVVVLSSGVAKTVLQLVAPANTQLAVTAMSVTFDGISATAVPVVVKVMRQTTAGTMSTRTPLKISDSSTTIQATGQENATVEPTASDVLYTYHVHPQQGVIWPLQIPDGEINMAGGTRLGLQCNAPAGVNALGTIVFEE